MKVTSIGNDRIIFEDGTQIYSLHEFECCENHYLDFTHLSMEDFDGLEFDLSGNDFFIRVVEYGIRLLPLNGHPVPIPGYGFNNGYYSTELTLVVDYPDGTKKEFDVSDCQSDGYINLDY